MKSKLKKVLFWNFYLIILTFFFLILDFVITKTFFSDFYKTNINKVEKQDQYWRVKNEIYHHDFLPNINVIEDNGKFGKYNFITNSMGFKDKVNRNISYKKKDYRIVFIGDSFTEGLFLPYDKTFVGVIDEKLSTKNIEILNAGVSTYSPLIYYKKIEFLIKNGFEFDELIVFIDISDIEDEAIVYKLDNFKVIKTKDKKKIQRKKNTRNYIDFLKKNFYISYSFLNFVHDKTIPTLNKSKITEDEFINFIVSDKHTRDKWTINKEIRNKYEIGIANSLKYMKLLNDLCKKHNIKISIAVYPWISQIYYEDLDSLQVSIWQTFSNKNQIKFYNFFPDFINNQKNLNKIDYIKKVTIPFDAHFNEEGNRIIGENFVKRYIEFETQ